MTTKVKTVTIIASPKDIPDGIYEGKWSAYVVNVVINNKLFQLGTKDGVRGLDVPCIVTAKDGAVTVESVKML